MKIALLQLNFTVGDLTGNGEKIRRAAESAGKRNADLCITSELALTGYPPRDLLLDTWFVHHCKRRLQALAEALSGGPAILIGAPEPAPRDAARPLYNTAFLLHQGTVQGAFRKKLLPNYDVFDEVRYFEPGLETNVFELQGKKIGVTICEDIWNDAEYPTGQKYHERPVAALASSGVDCIVNLSSSPFTLGKQRFREDMITEIAQRYKVSFLYVNQTGGNDDLVFDGRSLAVAPDGSIVGKGAAFEQDTLLVDLDNLDSHPPTGDMGPEEESWAALVLGTRDYVHKSGFTDVLIGLSGGVDSSLTAAIAVEALGPERVLGVLMPSPHTSRTSMEDAHALAGNLGIKTLTLPIGELMEVYDQTLADAFEGFPRDVTEENIQARIRGNLLMALSNKYGSMLMTTGNKSELAVGYCTIYGDMAGGFAVLADVPKTLVYALCRWLNARRGSVIPENVLLKPPSAELKPDQTDQDVLPPYEMLDIILEHLLEGHASVEELTAQGFDQAMVERIISMVRGAEFKRKQIPPGIKITDRAFGTGWRMPIASRVTYKE